MKSLTAFISSMFIVSVAFANPEPDVKLTGNTFTIKPVTVNKPQFHQHVQNHAPKTITLLEVKLSEHAWETLEKRTNTMLNQSDSHPELLQRDITGNVQLGMNNVPVLDQGHHGTCATFAVTAALDAVLGQGDYISQTCSLQLGQYLERLGYNPSGWNGSLNTIILNQMRSFGLVNKTMERSVGCGELTAYPAQAEFPEEGMQLQAYHEISEPLLEDEIAWTPLLDVYQVFLDRHDGQKTLESVKTALKHHDRLTFGVLLFALNKGVAGAVGKHKQQNDTWVLTPTIADEIIKQKNFGGHAMLITGFNDHATAVDDMGVTHRGLLTIRNSWGEGAGDHGNFYMSYDYFKLLTLDVERIRALKRAAG